MARPQAGLAHIPALYPAPCQDSTPLCLGGSDYILSVVCGFQLARSCSANRSFSEQRRFDSLGNVFVVYEGFLVDGQRTGNRPAATRTGGMQEPPGRIVRGIIR